jgi:LemA protein
MDTSESITSPLVWDPLGEIITKEQMSETEDQIASSRIIYNQNVELYNTTITSFPQSIIASFHSFQPAVFFEL